MDIIKTPSSAITLHTTKIMTATPTATTSALLLIQRYF